MQTKLLVQDLATFTTPLLAVFVVDAAPGKSDSPQLELLTASEDLAKAAETVLASGEFKAGLGDTLVHRRTVCFTYRLRVPTL